MIRVPPAFAAREISAVAASPSAGQRLGWNEGSQEHDFDGSGLMRIMSGTPYIAAIILTLLLACATPYAAFADAEPDPIAAIVAKAMPAAVRIVIVRQPKPEDNKTGVTIPIAAMSEHASTAFGSGFIFDPSGFIATNWHVIQDATSVIVVTADGVRHQARIVGMPSKLVDMALLHIDTGEALPAIPFGNSDKM